MAKEYLPEEYTLREGVTNWPEYILTTTGEWAYTYKGEFENPRIYFDAEGGNPKYNYLVFRRVEGKIKEVDVSIHNGDWERLNLPDSPTARKWIYDATYDTYYRDPYGTQIKCGCVKVKSMRSINSLEEHVEVLNSLDESVSVFDQKYEASVIILNAIWPELQMWVPKKGWPGYFDKLGQSSGIGMTKLKLGITEPAFEPGSLDKFLKFEQESLNPISEKNRAKVWLDALEYSATITGVKSKIDNVMTNILKRLKEPGEEIEKITRNAHRSGNSDTTNIKEINTIMQAIFSSVPLVPSYFQGFNFLTAVVRASVNNIKDATRILVHLLFTNLYTVNGEKCQIDKFVSDNAPKTTGILTIKSTANLIIRVLEHSREYKHLDKLKEGSLYTISVFNFTRIVTMFTHTDIIVGGNDLLVKQRVLDALIFHHPLLPIYISASYLLIPKIQEIVFKTEPEQIHNKTWPPIDSLEMLGQILEKAYNLYNRFPPPLLLGAPPPPSVATGAADVADDDASSVVGANPVGANPVGANPVGAKPAVAKPVGANPAVAKPVGANPAVAKSADADARSRPAIYKYFEEQEQGKLFCGKHALNNLLGAEFYTAKGDATAYAEEELKAIVTQRNVHLILTGGASIPLDLNRFCNYISHVNSRLIDDAENEACPSNGNFSTSILKLALTVLGYNVDSTIGKMVADHNFEKDRDEETLIGYMINYGNYHWVCLLYTGTNYLYKDSIEKSVKPEMAPIPYKRVKEYLTAKADGGAKIAEFYKVSTGGVPSMGPIQSYREAEREEVREQVTLNAKKAELKGMLDRGINEDLKDGLALIIDSIYEDAQVEKMRAILSNKAVMNTIKPKNITNHIDAFLLVYGLSTDENETIKQIQNDLTNLFALTELFAPSDVVKFKPLDIMVVYFICCKYDDAHEILYDSIGKDDGINGVLSRKYKDIRPTPVNGQPERKSTKVIRCQSLDVFIDINLQLTVNNVKYSTSHLNSSSVYNFCHAEVVDLGDEEEEE